MRHKRNKPEYTLQLLNGVQLFINEIGPDRKGMKCFLVTDVTNRYGSFVIKANGKPFKNEKFTPLQKGILPQVMKLIEQITAAHPEG